MTTGSNLLDLSPVIPVVVIDAVADAAPLAEALLAGGIRVIEVTLRTPAALDAIASIHKSVPDIVLGAGTVTSPAQAVDATSAGASFLVTPGTTPDVLEACLATGRPFLPGVSTVSEAMRMAEQGLTALKFFPAEAAGGVDYLKSIAGPLPGLRFCPTGGISLATAPRYLALPNVGCVGGSWLAPKNVVAAKDFGRVEALAKEAMALARD